MASHTAEELREAARVLGAAARELGLDPARMGRASRRLRCAWTAWIEHEDLELDVPAFARGAPAAVRSAGARSAAAPRASAPFDGERDIIIHRAA